MRLIKSPIRSSTSRFGSRYAGNSPPACAESVGAWNSAALTAVTTNKDEYFVSTPHLPQPARANHRVFCCVLGWGMSGFGPPLPLGIMVACALVAPAAEFSASPVKVDITPSASKWLSGDPAWQKKKTGIEPVQVAWTVTHAHSAPEVGPHGLLKLISPQPYNHEPDH